MRYCVTIHNDEEHSYPYVIEVLSNELQIDEALAMAIAQRIDQHGSVSIEVLDQNAAEALQLRLRSHGPDHLLHNSGEPLKITLEQGEELPSVAWWNSQKDRPPSSSFQSEALPIDYTPFVINAVGMAFALFTATVRVFLPGDSDSDVTFHTVGKCAAIVFILWSVIIYMRPIVKARRGDEPFPIPGLEFILIGIEIGLVISFA